MAAMVPLGLLALFYMWIGVVRAFVGRPPSVDYLPRWLDVWGRVVGVPLLFLVPPGVFLVACVCLVALLFRHLRGPAGALLLSSAFVFGFLGWFDPGGWFRWFLD
jgi:hypothetical protein